MTPDKNYYNRALKYLSIRSRSKKEIIDYLRKKGASDFQIDDTIDKLVRLNFINDLDFAKNYIRSKANIKNKSNFVIVRELENLGIDKDTIDQAFCNSLEISSDDEKAKKLILKKYKDTLVLKDYETRRKVIGYLISKGFSYSTSKQTIDELMREIV